MADTPKLVFAPHWERPPIPARLRMIGGAVALAFFAILMLLSPLVALTAAGVTSVVVLFYFSSVSSHNAGWLLFSLLLIEILPSATFLPVSDDQRPILRYPLYLIFCGPVLARAWRSKMLWRGGFRLYLIYFGMAFISVSYSLSPMFSFGRALAASFLFVAIYSIADETHSPAELQRVLRFYFAGCGLLIALLAVMAIIPVLHDYAWSFDQELGQDRFAGFLESPNQVGELCMVTIGVGLAVWRSLEGRNRRIVCASVIAIASWLLVVADSRSAALAMLAGIVWFAVWKYRWRGLLLVAGGLAVVMIAVMLVGPGALRYLNRHDVTSLTGRTLVWRFSIAKVKASPLLGYGYSVEGQIFQNKFFPYWDELWMQGPRISVHNAYLSKAVSLGLPALGLWMFLFLRPLISGLAGTVDSYRLRPAIILIVIPILILSMSETLAGDSRYPAGLISVFIWAMAEKSRLEAKDRSKRMILEEPIFRAVA